MWSHNTLWYSFSFPDTWWYRAYFLLSIDHLYILLRNVYLGHLSYLHQIIMLSCCKIGFLIYFNSSPVLNIWFAYIFLLIHVFLFIVFQCFFLYKNLCTLNLFCVGICSFPWTSCWKDCCFFPELRCLGLFWDYLHCSFIQYFFSVLLSSRID